MKLQLARILIIQFISITCCVAIQYDCDNRNVSCGCGFKNVEIHEENNNTEDVIPHSWSMMVSIRYDCHETGDPSTHCCGGTILNDIYILTAASCFNSSDNSSLVSGNITIAAGIHNLSQKCQTIRVVDQIFIHPDWTPDDEAMHNIAILRLAEPLDFKIDYLIGPACFPSRMDNSSEDNSTLTVIGWNISENSDRVLQQLVVYPIGYNDSHCAESVNGSTLLFCAGRQEGLSFFSVMQSINSFVFIYSTMFSYVNFLYKLFFLSLLLAEVGGPLFQWIGDRWELIGIESYGMNGCPPIGYKGLFVRVAAYYDWIKSIVYPENITASSTVSETTEQISTTSERPSFVYKCNTSSSCGCSYSDVEFSRARIVGGRDAVEYSWSMIVSLRFYGTEEHSCAGTLLSSSYILTAAHCVDHFTTADPTNITVVAGVTNRSDPERYVRNIDRIYLHPNYTSSPNFLNNIALLHVDRPFYFENNPVLAKTCVHRINSSIPMDVQPTENGTRLVVIGWGAMRPGSFVVSDYLKQIQIYAIDDQDQICKDSISNTELQFCAGLYEGRKGK
jgi:secreted trypsin-like serine protease